VGTWLYCVKTLSLCRGQLNMANTLTSTLDVLAVCENRPICHHHQLHLAFVGHTQKSPQLSEHDFIIKTCVAAENNALTSY